ncbi:DUF6479 family protein [Streptomyces showdoensis]|uniref:DUF6479 family protein n=1 Tax=Streptomyces showdoensis TaxID=68268 RepID=UPI00336C3EBD
MDFSLFLHPSAERGLKQGQIHRFAPREAAVLVLIGVIVVAVLIGAFVLGSKVRDEETAPPDPALASSAPPDRPSAGRDVRVPKALRGAPHRLGQPAPAASARGQHRGIAGTPAGIAAVGPGASGRRQDPGDGARPPGVSPARAAV